MVSRGELFEVWRSYFPGVVVEGLVRLLEAVEICYSSFGYDGVIKKMVSFSFLFFSFLPLSFLLSSKNLENQQHLLSNTPSYLKSKL